jgi:predicted nucleic acid-binding protein
MSNLVVDASVAAKWGIMEEDSAAALRLLDGEHRLLVPDLIWAELGNIVWKYHRRGLVDADDVAGLIRQFQTVPLEVHSSGLLLEAAVDLAIQTSRTVYDCLYVALAIREGCQMVTADRRLVNALAGGPLERYVRWIGEK